MKSFEVEVIALLEKLVVKQMETLKIFNNDKEPQSPTPEEFQRYKEYVERRLREA
jgi:hypothetical protein